MLDVRWYQHRSSTCSAEQGPAAQEGGQEPFQCSLSTGRAEAHVHMLPPSHLKPAPSLQQLGGSSSPCYEDSRGNKKISPSAMSTFINYISHVEVKIGRQMTTGGHEPELNSQALPDTYVPAPRPANEAQRQATVESLNIVGAPANPYLYNLCRLVCPGLTTFRI